MEVEKAKELRSNNDINILVVDDREDNLLSIETILEKDHYNIFKANSGRAALKCSLTAATFHSS